MFCEHCGKQLVDPDLYCEHCGNPLPEELVKHRGTDLLKAVTFLVWSSIKRYKVALICILLLAVLATSGFMAADYLKTVIDPTDYITIHLSGYASGGTVEGRFDEDHLLTYRLMGLGAAEIEALEAAYETEETKLAAMLYFAEMAKEHSNIDDIFTLQYSVTGTNGKLSNGDIIRLEIMVNQDILETYGLHTFKKRYEADYKIGTDTPMLPEPTSVDLFSRVKVSAEGPDGYGKLYLKVPEEPIPLTEPIDGVHSFQIAYHDGSGWGDAYLKFRLLDENHEEVNSQSVSITANQNKPCNIENLVNGDSITVSATDANGLEDRGIFLTGTEKTITVDNLRGMEEIDLLRILEYEFCGPDGNGYVQFLPGTYQVPVSYSGDGKKELTVQVVQDPDYDFYDEYSWIPPAVITFTVSPAENVTQDIRIRAYPDPYKELKNGDTVNFLIDQGIFGNATEELKKAGYTLTQKRGETVAGLLTPVELKLSEILDYGIEWKEDGGWLLNVGTTKTTELPENDLGIRELTTTLRKENESSTTAYILNFAFTTEDGEGKTQEHSVDCEINISRNEYYRTVTFDLIREKYRDLWKYGLAIEETYEQISVDTES